MRYHNIVWTKTSAYKLGSKFYDWFIKNWPHPNAHPKSKRIIKKMETDNICHHVFLREIKYSDRFYIRYKEHNALLIHKKYTYKNGVFKWYKIFDKWQKLITEGAPKPVNEPPNRNGDPEDYIKAVGNQSAKPIPAPSTDYPKRYIVKEACAIYGMFKELIHSKNGYYQSPYGNIFLKKDFIDAHPEWFELPPAIVTLYREYRDFRLAGRSHPYHPNSYIEAEAVGIINTCIEDINETVNKLVKFKMRFIDCEQT